MSSEAAGSSLKICRTAFFVAVAAFVYGTTFPFHFHFNTDAIRQAWASAGVIPFWDVARGRIHSFPDMTANLLLGSPIGFFGYLWLYQAGRRNGILRWGAIGLAFGLFAETAQLALPHRTSGLTDALCDALGALAGAAAAAIFGGRVRSFLEGSFKDVLHARLFLAGSAVVLTALAPLDVTLDVSQVRRGFLSFLADPWELGAPIGDELVVASMFAIFGALAGRLLIGARRARRNSEYFAVLLALVSPLLLEVGQGFIASHSPSLRDLALNLAGAGSGFAAALWMRRLATPVVGLLALSASLVVAGASPFVFAPQARFQWRPLVEYYVSTTASALYDAIFGIVAFALFTVLIRSACSVPRPAAVAAAAALAGAIEALQMFVPQRYAGTTDIVTAALGAWAGNTIHDALMRMGREKPR